MGVFAGSKLKTQGGLTKKDLMKNKTGKIISKKRYATGRKNFKKGGIKKMDARGYKSKKKSWHHWLLRSQEGKCPLQRSPKNLRRINQPVSFAPFTLPILETIS